MKNEFTVLIPDGEGDDFGIKATRCLGQAPNVKVGVLSRERWTSVRFSKYQSRFFSHEIDEFDMKQLGVILEAAKQIKADIILPLDWPMIRFLSAHRDEVEKVAALPPLPAPELIDTVSDKWLFAEILKRENLPFPATFLYEREKINTQDFATLNYPILVKPRIGLGGSEIVFFDDHSQLVKSLENPKYGDKYILQEFIPGYDASCNVLCQDGEILAYTIQKGIHSGNSRFEPPSGLEFIQDEQILSTIRKLVRAINWSGVANFDFRYDENNCQPKLLEMNPRFWGSLVASLAAGVNFPYLACLAGLGIEFPQPEYRLTHYIKPELSVRLFIRKYLKGDANVGNLTNTGLPYLLGDPLPEFQKLSTKIYKRLFKIKIFSKV